MNNHKKIPKSQSETNKTANETVIEGYDYLGASCSATDCTGLIPRGNSTEAEREAYEEMYPYQPRPVQK